VQIVERASEWAPYVDSDVLTSTCSKWNEYQTASALIQDDSGL
jgi:hypothetical protein